MSQAEVEAALKELFDAYDVDGGGDLSRDEFLQIEMRLAFDSGQVFNADTTLAQITKVDHDGSGTLDFNEFRERQLESLVDADLSLDMILTHLREHVKKCYLERARMGSRFHAGIRQSLKRIFSLYDKSGDGMLSVDEWLSAQKVVAAELGDDIDEAWVDEGAFAVADSDGNGELDINEFMESSLKIFEGSGKRSEQIHQALLRIVKGLEKKRAKLGDSETPLVSLMLQADPKPEFQPPHLAWQDEPTDGYEEIHADAWVKAGTISLPRSLVSCEEVCSAIRMCLQMPKDTLLSIFFVSPCIDSAGFPSPQRRVSARLDPSSRAREGAPPSRCPELLRGEKAGTGNVERALDMLCKPNTPPVLYIKNVRKKPGKCERQGRVFLEDRSALLAKHAGMTWGLDWGTQIVGSGARCPWPFVVTVGDAIVVEVPLTDDGGQYRYVSTCFMDDNKVLSPPLEQDLDPEKKKNKKKADAGAPEPVDQFRQLTFVALRDGKCVFFVEVSWEDQEERLTSHRGLTAPVAENTVARIGPLQVEVNRASAGESRKEKSVQWWNGEKWSAKKGPALRQTKKRPPSKGPK